MTESIQHGMGAVACEYVAIRYAKLKLKDQCSERNRSSLVEARNVQLSRCHCRLRSVYEGVNERLGTE